MIHTQGEITVKKDFWKNVAEKAEEIIKNNEKDDKIIDKSQIASLRNIVNRLSQNGVILADEVGMGKTRIAAFLVRAVCEAGGRSAILIPPGLAYQWKDELRQAEFNKIAFLRNSRDFFSFYQDNHQKIGYIKPWYKEPVMLISHLFANWRFRNNSERCMFLPQLYVYWCKQNNKRVSRECRDINEFINVNTYFSCIDKRTKEFSDFWESIENFKEYGHNLDENKDEYQKDGEMRAYFEKAVGIGLGHFDLVIIDEAHKNRGEESGLTRLLGNVILQRNHTRCMAMTATPIELDCEQWKQSLQRISVKNATIDDKKIKKIMSIIENYAEAVKKIRVNCEDEKYQQEYKVASNEFCEALGHYLLRRDKRQVPSVKKFLELYKNQNKLDNYAEYHSYRREEEIKIKTEDLDGAWKKIICAAESLSFVQSNYKAELQKRIRLTLGNGHGIAALIDQFYQSDRDEKQIELDSKQIKAVMQNTAEQDEFTGENAVKSKEKKRLEWWSNVLQSQIQQLQEKASKDCSVSVHVADAEEAKEKVNPILYSHPAIMAAVDKIEKVCQSGEKVLVFGRFTSPLQALTNLLNAREILRFADTWKEGNTSYLPVSTVPKRLCTVLPIAHKQLLESKQLNSLREFNLNSIDKILNNQYYKLDNQRSKFRKSFVEMLDQELSGQPEYIKYSFSELKKSDGSISSENSLSALMKALQELLGPEYYKAKSKELAEAFVNLAEAVRVGNDEDDNDKEKNEKFCEYFWEILNSEYSKRDSLPAQLMNGETRAETRRFMQMAFNRKNCNPKVLIAQSLVGREGLNLHKACRTVILLHPEWNPGVVEQQIGRVDRHGSLWEQLIEKAVITQENNADFPPRIIFCPVIFSGTYDEYNWSVLRERWAALRSQLHGIIIDPILPENKNVQSELAEKINKMAPNFQPKEDYLY